MLKGVLPVVALALLDRVDAYGYEVVQQLRAAGLTSVGEASVYGVLQRLYDSGDLSTYQVASESGPPRRYYAMTLAGRTNLERARKEWASFADSVDAVLGLDAIRGRS